MGTYFLFYTVLYWRKCSWPLTFASRVFKVPDLKKEEESLILIGQLDVIPKMPLESLIKCLWNAKYKKAHKELKR